ncbi:Phage baseplate assembly protein V [Qipengyuania citrea LAMA 915]|uniref:Phage baseplate assembly protein V n=1 Tax=Qipengyuania citrea LAMA 915 TaxID=1306953 RepID=A0A0L1KF84_9SPHN|nr:phage baseplate assembly protein V [Qipengyuania citrea]KNH02623.1 Phage baseplate assembly protein V [Qipengyuania citrea LAMA 915]
MWPLYHNQAEDIPADLAALIRVGTVLSVDLTAARCIVRYGDPDDPEAAETPAIRWLAMRAGKTRVWSPPSVGEQVLLLSPDGQVGNAVAIAGLVQDAFPPIGNDLTEAIEFEDGARLTYDPQAGALKAILPAGATAEINAPGGITLRGPVRIEGDVEIAGDVAVSQTLTAETDLLADGISLVDHLHGQVSAGTAKTGKPE